jgi:hypothetical protein
MIEDTNEEVLVPGKLTSSETLDVSDVKQLVDEELRGTSSSEPLPLERTAEESIELLVAKEAFEKGLKNRSFSGRNPELGPMIKCVRCGLRHRDNVKHDPIKYKEGTTQSEHGRPVANAAGWRAKPGKMYWIKELKKFLTLTR